MIQSDLNFLEFWCKKNGLEFNIPKCKVLRFSRKLCSEHYNYTLSSIVLENVTSFCDLGITIDSKLSFTFHINNIVSKANKMLGLVKRTCSEFTNLRSFIVLFSSFVRSILEYGVTIWSPYYKMHSQRIEKIQKKFVKFLCYKFNIFFNNYNYTMISYFGLTLLSKRRIMFDMCFVYKVLSGIVTCSNILILFMIHVPSRQVRNSHLLSIPYHRTLYAFQSPVSRLARLTLIYNEIEFVGISYTRFKSSIHRKILI